MVYGRVFDFTFTPERYNLIQVSSHKLNCQYVYENLFYCFTSDNIHVVGQGKKIIN